ncbi:MAG: LysM peptidoglycan-binding domain-containing protein [Chloroflexota bacterium]|nr:MAG: LysM peptidoglycan-binding domain-containing protein [Chloroflexota bacterium]
MPLGRYISRAAIPMAAALALLSVTASAVGAEPGYATWYGPGFNGNRMANGQIFDEDDPTTTASNQYPFGTWLKVTNPLNGRSVTVQVRDRGGFNHALDLSKAAFFALSPPNSWGFAVEYAVVDGPGSAPREIPGRDTPRPTPTATPAVSAPVRVSTPAVRDAPTEHVVEAGQTLRAIAALHDTTVTSLVEWNDIQDPDLVGVGQRLRLRAPVRSYIVRRGDTVYGIARQFGVLPATVVELNKFDNPDALSIDQEIAIPG